MKNLLVISVLLLSFLQTHSQENHFRKGRFFIAWGWNSSQYGRSDLHFNGIDYDFVLSNVKAVDDPTGFDPGIHLNPSKLTIPQTNFRLGYFINEKWSVSFGFDHMKYVMVEHQLSTITGTIQNSGTEYDGFYDKRELFLDRSLLEYENTDGLNYLHLELNRHFILWEKYNGNKAPTMGIELMAGVSAGMMMPRTDAHLLLYDRNNNYHITGYGTGLKLGSRLNFLKHFFIQPEIKGGWINMPEVHATLDDREHVSQNFIYSQYTLLFGGNFSFGSSGKN